MLTCIRLNIRLNSILDAEDIIDEALYYFKANVFFKNYEIKVNMIKSDSRTKKTI